MAWCMMNIKKLVFLLNLFYFIFNDYLINQIKLQVQAWSV